MSKHMGMEGTKFMLKLVSDIHDNFIGPFVYEHRTSTVRPIIDRFINATCFNSVRYVTNSPCHTSGQI
jgi:hypothetical protein